MMITGRDALATIENTIAKARNSEGQMDASLHSVEEEAARLRADRTAAFRQLARVRLDAFAQEGIVQQLDNAERRALELVKNRSGELKQMAEARAALFGAVQGAEADRHKKAATLEQALAGLEAVKRAAEPKIRSSASWKAQQERIAVAIKVADEAEKKTIVSEEDREQKRKPYEADVLFMYLWNAKFASAEYDAGFLTRFFDRLIARKVGYPDARANYSMLNEIPLRLREHAERCKLAIETEKQGLAKAEAAALSEIGAGELVGKVEAARQALVEAEKLLSGKKRALEDFEARTAAAAADPAYEQAVHILAEADSRQDVRELYTEASQTRTKDDDRIISQIEKIESRLAKAEQETLTIRAEARDIARRRADIERERDNFRQRGYDNPYGGFGNSGVLGQILGGILQGAVQGSILRDALQNGYRQRENPWNQSPSGNSGSIFGPLGVPDNSSSPPQSNNGWVPPWLDQGNSGGGSWGGDSGGSSWGGGGDSGSSGGDSGGFSTGGGV
jgi:hypothetical protein